MSAQTFYGVGNLTRDPEGVRFTQSGAAVLNLTIASTERRYDREAQRWVDGETTYTRLALFGQLAENAAESLHQGDRVIVHGRLR
jgi:single-strand DNA-binding protein